MTTTTQNTTMRAKTVVITGASSGIGAAAARALAAMGARVAVVGRDELRTRAVAKSCGGDARAFVADFSSLASVAHLAAELADTYPAIDVLANNAGFIAARDESTVDGIESTFAVNHVAPFLLTNLLDSSLRAAPAARVITTSSMAHSMGQWSRIFDPNTRFSSWPAYGDSKLANIAFTTEFTRRMAGTNVIANCFHPGVVRSGFGRDKGLLALLSRSVGRLVLISPEKGAATLVHLASDAAAGAITGKYWVKRKVAQPSPAARDEVAAGRLWEMTEDLVKTYAL